MNFNHAIRITLPYDDCRAIIGEWAERCQRVIVYQHDADAKVRKTHIHLVLGGCEVKSEALKRMWKPCPGKGNEFWSWKVWDEDVKALTYMSKGKFTPVFIKNFSNEEVEAARQAWIDPVEADSRPKDATQYYIDSMMEIYKSFVDLEYLEWYYLTEKFEMSNTITSSFGEYCELLLLDVRKKTMKFMFRETKRTPPATLYKTVCGTVFLNIADRCGILDKAITVLANKWY